MSEVDFEYLKTMAQRTQDTQETILTKVQALEHQMTAGFANMHAHAHAQHADAGMLTRRVEELELQVERLTRAEGINADD